MTTTPRQSMFRFQALRLLRQAGQIARVGLAGLRTLLPRRRSAAASAAASSLMSWIWRESRREQIPILVIIVCSLPFYYLVLDLPKQIINGPIQGRGFAGSDATRSLGDLVPLIAPVGSLAALEFDRWSALLVLCGLFATLIVVNGGFKLVINTAKGRLGEAMLQRLRTDLFARMLAMPTRDARRFGGAEVASLIKDEVEPLGGFIGDAYIMPVLLGAQALTAALFILLQSVWLGAIAVAIVIVQALIVPRLRRRLIELGRERQMTARELAGRVGEVVEGIGDVHANNATAFERSDVEARLSRIFKIRYEIYRRKFAIKFINNLLAYVPTLIFFLLGGALVLQGRLDVGQLVAVIVAYGELPGPIKELIDWDYQRQDMNVRFEQVTLQLPAVAVDVPTRRDHSAPQSELLPLSVTALTVDIAATGERLKRCDLEIRAGEHICATGEPGAGASALALALIGEASPTSGSITCANGGRYAIERVLGSSIVYVGEDPYVQQGSIKAALLYGLSEDARAAISAERLGQVLNRVHLEDDIFALALATRIKAAECGALAEIALAARRAMSAELTTGELAHAIVRYDPDRYDDAASIGENLAVSGERPDGIVDWSRQPAIAAILARHDIDRRLEAIGRTMAATAVDLYGELAHDNVLAVTQRLVPPDDIERYAALLSREDGSARQSADQDRRTLRALALTYVEPLHRLGLIDAAMRTQLIAARHELRHLPAGAGLEHFGLDAADPPDPERYDDARTLEQNIIFGSVVHEAAGGEQLVRAAIRMALDKLGRLDEILALGLACETGRAGRRLSLAQRQKLGMARALLKNSELLVADRPLNALTPRTQDAIVIDVLGWLADRNGGAGVAVYWVLSNAASASRFDRMLAFADGQIIEECRSQSVKTDAQIDVGKGRTP